MWTPKKVNPLKPKNCGTARAVGFQMYSSTRPNNSSVSPTVTASEVADVVGVDPLDEPRSITRAR